MKAWRPTGGQSVPAFDHYMAPGVAKTFIKELYKVMCIKYPQCSGPKDHDMSNEDIRDTLKEYRKKHRLILDRLDFVKGLIAEKYCLSLREPDIDQLIDMALKATDDATHQAMEAVVHNLNSMHSRAGAQVPFSSLNFGTDTSAEGRMASKNLLLATEEGLGNGETPIFPISIFKLKEGISYNPGDPNYDLFKLACRVTAKRLFPNFSNLDAPFNAQYYRLGDVNTEVGYMGCRTRVMSNIHDPNRQIVTGRGNLSFTSINLPRLGIKADGDINKFFNMLDDMMELVKSQLMHRLDVLCRKHPINFPFLMGQGVWIDSDKLGPNDNIRDVLRHGTLTIGFIGLAECLKALTGKHHGESAESQELGLRIISHMREFCDRAAQETKYNYSLIATPAEGLSGRFIKMDRQKYGILPGITDRKYYTNSFHVPVYYPISALDKIKIEAPYHEMCNGGHITYIELDGDPTKNLPAFEKIVRAMHDNNLGYFAINHPVDRDPVCGYTGIIDDVCPRCGRKENEPMTPEMWQRVWRLGTAPQAGCCGDPNEEADRLPNPLD